MFLKTIIGITQTLAKLITTDNMKTSFFNDMENNIANNNGQIALIILFPPPSFDSGLA